MVKVRSFIHEQLMRGGALLATVAMIAATFAANSACLIPYYEPEQPEGLEKWSKVWIIA